MNRQKEVNAKDERKKWENCFETEIIVLSG
jgi:hypothetical protein